MAKRSRRPRKCETRKAILRSSLRDLRSRDRIVIRRSTKTVGNIRSREHHWFWFESFQNWKSEFLAIFRHRRGYRSA